MKVCHKTCLFFFFPIISKYLCVAKRSLLSRCPSYIKLVVPSNDAYDTETAHTELLQGEVLVLVILN